jgi:hypothetical protein
VATSGDKRVIEGTGRSIHPSAWKGNSPKSVCRIPHILATRVPDRLAGPRPAGPGRCTLIHEWMYMQVFDGWWVGCFVSPDPRLDRSLKSGEIDHPTAGGRRGRPAAEPNGSVLPRPFRGRSGALKGLYGEGVVAGYGLRFAAQHRVLPAVRHEEGLGRGTTRRYPSGRRGHG